MEESWKLVSRGWQSKGMLCVNFSGLDLKTGNWVCLLGSRCAAKNHSNVNTVVLQAENPKSIVMKLKKHGHEHRCKCPVLLSLRSIFANTIGNSNDYTLKFSQNQLHVVFLAVLVHIDTSSGSRISYALNWMLNLT